MKHARLCKNCAYRTYKEGLYGCGIHKGIPLSETSIFYKFLNNKLGKKCKYFVL